MLFFEELVLRSLKASPWIKPVLDSLCPFEVRSHVKNRFSFRKNLSPVCRFKHLECLFFNSVMLRGT